MVGSSSGDGSLTLHDVMRPFVAAIVAKRPLLHLALSDRQRRRTLESISGDLRKLGDVVTPTLIAPLVSIAARAAAERKGIDLCQEDWHSQTRFDPGRSLFHVEHVTTVSALREMCLHAPSEEVLVHSLTAGIRIAWILKDEDAKLTQLGYRSHRPDPDIAYRQAGIDLVPCHSQPPSRLDATSAEVPLA
jgi:hypothetical protein